MRQFASDLLWAFLWAHGQRSLSSGQCLEAMRGGLARHLLFTQIEFSSSEAMPMAVLISLLLLFSPNTLWSADISSDISRELRQLYAFSKEEARIGRLTEEHALFPEVRQFGTRMADEYDSFSLLLERFASHHHVSLRVYDRALRDSISDARILYRELEQLEYESFDTRFSQIIAAREKARWIWMKSNILIYKDEAFRNLLKGAYPALEQRMIDAQKLYYRFGRQKHR